MTTPTGDRAETMTLRQRLAEQVSDAIYDEMRIEIDDEYGSHRVVNSVAFALLDYISDRAGGSKFLL